MMIMNQNPYMMVWTTVLPKVLGLDGVGLGRGGVAVGVLQRDHNSFQFLFTSLL